MKTGNPQKIASLIKTLCDPIENGKPVFNSPRSCAGLDPIENGKPAKHSLFQLDLGGETPWPKPPSAGLEAIGFGFGRGARRSGVGLGGEPVRRRTVGRGARQSDAGLGPSQSDAGLGASRSGVGWGVGQSGVGLGASQSDAGRGASQSGVGLGG